MIFLTVGTQFPFDRLVRSVDLMLDKALLEEEVFAQVGYSSFKPKNMQYAEQLDKVAFSEKVDRARCLISHAGIGTILAAMNHNKPVLVMPRMKCFKEHVNDHQIATAKKFEQLGHILVAYETEELPVKIEELKSFVPRKREAQPHAVAERIARFLNDLANNGK